MALGALRSRLARLERASLPQPSPIERMYGSLEAFEADALAQVKAGVLDGRDMPSVIAAVQRWHRDVIWTV